MEKTKSEVTLGVRLATRYIPNQILSSALPWGPLIGAPEVKRLEKYFSTHSVTRDGDPALTKEWLVYAIMKILEEKSNSLVLNTAPPSPHIANSAGDGEEESLQLQQQQQEQLIEERLQECREEVSQWISSFSTRLNIHDPLWEICDTSNEELAKIEREENNNNNNNEGRLRRGINGRSRSILRLPNNYASSTSIVAQRRGMVPRELVRWSDLTTNFVRDYEFFHRFDEKELSFTRVRAELVSRQMSFTRNSQNKERNKRKWSKIAQQMKDSDSDVVSRNEFHLLSADFIIVSPITGYIVTASKDGIVKIWDGNTGDFIHNLYNAGSSWVIGMFLLMDEDYILIATTNHQLTILDFPDGNVLQKYVGCHSNMTAFHEILQPSAQNIQRYGMKPGECGIYRVELHKGEAADQYHRRRREAHNNIPSKTVPAKPIVNFLSPTACWFDSYTGIFFFGTAEGKIGAFDISADVKPSSLLSGANSKPVRLLFFIEAHVGAVVGMFYTSYANSLYTAGTDGCIRRIPIGPNSEPTGELRLIGHPSRSIRMMQWAPPSKYFITIHVDRRVVLWIIGRNGDPMHSFPPETQEVISAALHPRRQRLAILLSDKTIKVYETHGNKSLSTITQPAPEPNFTAADVTRRMMESSLSDENGVVAWHPYHSSLICGLRAAVIYEPSRSHHRSENEIEGGQMLLLPITEAERATSAPTETETESGSLGRTHSPITSVGASESRKIDSHRGGIVSMLVHKQSLELHTFDEESWRLWSVENGTLRRHIDIPRVARMEHISLKRATVASSSWTTTAQTRLVTGGQDCSILTWDPETGTPLASEIIIQDSSEQLDSDVSVFAHRNKLIAWSARTCQITSFTIGSILPSGIEESKSVIIRVPSLVSVTACCVIRDVYLCLGTGDAKLFFYSISGGSPIFDSILKEKNEDERGAIVQLIFLNEQNQNIILAILDIGVLYVYSYVSQSILCRIRLLRRFECRIRKVLYIPEDCTVICGDSTGRIKAFDVRGCNSTSVDFRQIFFQKFSFQGATDEITSLESFIHGGNRHLIIGSLDHYVRLFQLQDSNWMQSTVLAPGTSFSRNSTVDVIFVGAFGRDTWRLSDTETFSTNPPVPSRVLAAPSSEEEALLESLVYAEVRAESVRSGGYDSLTEEEGSLGRAKSQRVGKVTGGGPPSPCPASPRAQATRNFFITDPHAGQEEIAQRPSLSFTSSSESFKQLHYQQYQQQQQRTGSPLLSSPDGSLPTSRIGDNSLPSFNIGRRAQGRVRLGGGGGGGGNINTTHVTENSGIIPRTERYFSSLNDVVNSFNTTSEDNSGTQKAKMMLLSMTRRLEAVQPSGCVKGEFSKKANEILLRERTSFFKRDKTNRTRPGTEELQMALETRRQLAERMEEYKKQQEAKKRSKKNNLPIVSARHHLTPVIIPQPNMISADVKAGYSRMFEVPITGAPTKPSVTSVKANNTM